MTVQVIDGRECYTCPKCDAVSYNPHDVENWYCGACHTFAEDLKNEYVTELDLTGIDEKNWPRRTGDCFTCAILALFQFGDANATLVHGYAKNAQRKPSDPEYVLHAWVETEGTYCYKDGSECPGIVVIDLTQLHKSVRILPRDDYYRASGIHAHLPMARFTRGLARLNALYFGNDGPWPGVSPSSTPAKQ